MESWEIPDLPECEMQRESHQVTKFERSRTSTTTPADILWSFFFHFDLLKSKICGSARCWTHSIDSVFSPDQEPLS